MILIRPVFFPARSQATHYNIHGFHKQKQSPTPFFNGIPSHSFSLSLHKPPLKLSASSDSNSASSLSTMDPNPSSTGSGEDDEVEHDLYPIMKVYKNGRVERLAGEEITPPSLDPTTNVESRDVVISQNDGVSARLFLPKLETLDQKLPVLVYFHGGAFCIETPFSPNYHNYMNSIVSQTGVLGVSVDYRRAPEHPVPAAHEDGWTAIKWVASHFEGNGPDEWLNRHADLGKVFFAGDSAGANISHHMAIRVGSGNLRDLKLEAIVLAHPYFWGADRIGSEANRAEFAGKADNLWRFSCPSTSGSDDPLINPAKDPNVGKLGCGRVLVCVAEKDLLRDRGWYYKEVLEKGGFRGSVEVMEAKEEDHVFHMFKPDCENALAMLRRIVSFIKQD